jgi:hypothetical protein
MSPLPHLLPDLPAVTVTAVGLEAVRHGRALDGRLVETGFPAAPPPARMRVLDGAGLLIALAVPQGFDPPAPGLSLEPVLHPDIVLVD